VPTCVPHHAPTPLCLVLGAGCWVPAWARVLWVCNTRIRVVMSCPPLSAPSSAMASTGAYHKRPQTQPGLRGAHIWAARPGSSAHTSMPWAGYGHDGESFAFWTVVDYARTRRWLLTWAAKGVPSLPMTTFCLFAPPGQPNDEPWCRIPRGQDHVATSFATGMLHRPCVARLIAGIRGSTHTVQAGSDGTAVGQAASAEAAQYVFRRQGGSAATQ
jgi:hypothetical protein